MVGLSSFQTNNNAAGGGSPFASGANNGLSVDVLGNVVLGNDVGEVGSPGQLLSDREIFDNGFSIILSNLLGQEARTSINGFLALDAVTGANGNVTPGRIDIGIDDGSFSPRLTFYDSSLSVEAIMRMDAISFEMQGRNNQKFFEWLGTSELLLGDVDSASSGLSGTRLLVDPGASVADLSNDVLNASYSINGNVGFTGSGLFTNFTIEGGIITNATL